MKLDMWRYMTWLLSAGCICGLSVIDKGSLYGTKKTDRLVHVAAVEGQSAELPCDVTPPAAGDSLRLVLWYYGAEGTIYTYDARGGGGGVASGAHWASAAQGGERLRFRTDSSPAALRISAVSRADAGLYRCRADFQAAPTRNSRVNLTVIVPPQKPVVLDASGHRIENNIVGPHRLGSFINITCAAYDGSPAPNVTWWRGGARLGGRWVRAPDGSVRAPLQLGPLTRADHGARLTCLAAFHPFSSALSTAVEITMLLPPETVALRPPAEPITAGRPVTLTCHVTGAEPMAVISWRRGSSPVPADPPLPSADGNGTVSQLTFTPEADDQGQTVTCSAMTPAAGGAAIEDAVTLHVHYAPIVSLSARPEGPLQEGQTVRLHCSVRAEPPVTQLRWTHESRWLPEPPRETPGGGGSGSGSGGSGGGGSGGGGVGGGGSGGGAELVLADVSANVSGNYSCHATNPLGTSESEALTLRVRHAPVCVSDIPGVLEAARGDSLNVSCQVAAFPEPLHFRWSFNSSDALLPQQEFSPSLLNGSSIGYTPRLMSEFGALLCWATNAIAEQRVPCVTRVSPADVPDAPSDCDVIGRTRSSLLVRCRPGFDGGSRQAFRMEVHGAGDTPVDNVTSSSPRLSVSGLRPGQQYRLSVSAYNSRGSSGVTALVARTLADEQAQHRQGGSLSDMIQLTPLLGVLVGVLSALVLTAVIVVTARRCRARPPAKENQQGVSHVQLVNNYNDLGSVEEKHDPDLIPQKTEYMDPEEKHMIERLRNSRFPPPPARFGDSSALSPSETRLLSPSETCLPSPVSRTLPRLERMSSCGTQTGPPSPRNGKSATLQLRRASRRLSSCSHQPVHPASSGHQLTKF